MAGKRQISITPDYQSFIAFNQFGDPSRTNTYHEIPKAYISNIFKSYDIKSRDIKYLKKLLFQIPRLINVILCLFTSIQRIIIKEIYTKMHSVQNAPKLLHTYKICIRSEIWEAKLHSEFPLRVIYFKGKKWLSYAENNMKSHIRSQHGKGTSALLSRFE